ncbi:leucine-rich repeat domain-containing protein [Chryseobacterium sp. DT-3]|uniref:leucine-rich repeat domain-containing protein n=1 Tax=Chryseobacterium sp. DT-3 TaxID=3396164 RepID=UPI003F1DDFB9
MKTKEELRLLFENGDKPTQEDFWTWLDSYWHKDEKIDMVKIAGLENGLPRLNDFYADIDEDGNASFASLSVRKIFIKPGTLKIPDQFASNMGLSVLFLADSVTTIGSDAFSINSLQSLTIPENVTEINDRAFSSNQLSSLIIPGNVKEIKDSAFASNRLTSLQIASGVAKIGHYAFKYNPDLSSVTLSPSTQYYSDSFDSNIQVIGGNLIS